YWRVTAGVRGRPVCRTVKQYAGLNPRQSPILPAPNPRHLDVHATPARPGTGAHEGATRRARGRDTRGTRTRHGVQEDATRAARKKRKKEPRSGSGSGLLAGGQSELAALSRSTSGVSGTRNVLATPRKTNFASSAGPSPSQFWASTMMI